MNEAVCTQGHAYKGERCTRCGGVAAQSAEPLESEVVVEAGTEAEAEVAPEAEEVDVVQEHVSDGAEEAAVAEAEAVDAEGQAQAEAEAEEDAEDLE